MPYPSQYLASLRLDDGTELLVRPIRPEDESLIVDLHAGHSEHTLRMRFFGLVRTLTHDSLIRLCHLDYDREIALAAIHHTDGRPHMAGVSRYHLRPETGEAEFAVVITDAWQRRGLGTHLLQRLIDIARERKVRRLLGQVLAENDPMLRLVKRLGFRVQSTSDPSVVEAILDLEVN
jgi:acetyltransferase